MTDKLVYCLNCLQIQRILDEPNYIPECLSCKSNALEETNKSNAITITLEKLKAIGSGAFSKQKEDKDES